MPATADGSGDVKMPKMAAPVLHTALHFALRHAKQTLATILSRLLSYRNASALTRYLARTSTSLHLHGFDILGKIPDESCVIVFKHGFKVFGKVADFYLIGAASPRKVRGLFYPGLFKNDFCKPFLEQWRAISTGHLLHINRSLGPEESVAIAVDGLEQLAGRTSYLGAAWIAEKTGLPLVPLRIISTGNVTRLEARGRIFVPKNASREKLREITDMVLRELSR